MGTTASSTSSDKATTLDATTTKLIATKRRRFTDELKDSVGEQWDRVVRHRFAKEVAADGTIGRDAMKRFLVQDHRFLDAFVVLLASVIANARCLDDRIPGCQFLALITGKENAYFKRCFAKLEGCSSEEEEDRSDIPDADCAEGFCNLMRDVAHNGTLAQMLSVLVVCEWNDLHSGDFFVDVVEYVRGLLDKEGERILADGDLEEQDACMKRFQQAVQLEEDFYNYTFSGEF